MAGKKTSIETSVPVVIEAPKTEAVMMRLGNGKEIRQLGFLRSQLLEGKDVIVEASGRRISQMALVIGPIFCEDRFAVPGAVIGHVSFTRKVSEDTQKGYYCQTIKVLAPQKKEA